MTKINMKELIADREAGTPGDWRVHEDGRYYGIEAPNDVSIIVWGEGGDDWCGVRGTEPGELDAHANARRIARLPDLEAAYIEAVELLRDIEESLTADNEYRLLREAARNFLEKNS